MRGVDRGSIWIEGILVDGQPNGSLAATRHFAVILRLAVDGKGKVSGELVDPGVGAPVRFSGLESLPQVVSRWLATASGG